MMITQEADDQATPLANWQHKQQQQQWKNSSSKEAVTA
jgi:hypothetical protein